MSTGRPIEVKMMRNVIECLASVSVIRIKVCVTLLVELQTSLSFILVLVAVTYSLEVAGKDGTSSQDDV
jgi:hypothetical protein